MDHNVCLKALLNLGAKREDVELVAAFLKNRMMKVKVGSTFSVPRHAPGGSPQGSILGGFLFCVTTDEYNTLKPEERAGVPLEVIDDMRSEAGALHSQAGVDRMSTSSSDSFDSDRDNEDSFVFFRKRRRHELDETEVSFRLNRSEIERQQGVPDKWENKTAVIKAYIDDLNIIEKIRHSDAVTHISQNKQEVVAHSPQSEDLFRQIESGATDLGMCVNTQKTQVLCISASNSGNVTSFINTSCGRIKSSDQLKILGFWFEKKPGIDLHMEKLERKIRSRLWALRHLKRSGMGCSDLVFLYKSVVRSVADFASITYHTMLSATQSNRLEALQRRALKIIYGTNKTSSELLEVSGLPVLSERRERMFVNFALKARDNNALANSWFPEAEDSNHDTRQKKKYKEFNTRTTRLQKSPLYQLRKRLNNL